MGSAVRTRTTSERALRGELEAAQAELRSVHDVQAAITHILSAPIRSR